MVPGQAGEIAARSTAAGGRVVWRGPAGGAVASARDCAHVADHTAAATARAGREAQRVTVARGARTATAAAWSCIRNAFLTARMVVGGAAAHATSTAARAFRAVGRQPAPRSALSAHRVAAVASRAQTADSAVIWQEHAPSSAAHLAAFANGTAAAAVGQVCGGVDAAGAAAN